MTSTPTDNARAAAEIVEDAPCLCCCRPLSEHNQKRQCPETTYFVPNLTAHMPSPDTHAAKVSCTGCGSTETIEQIRASNPGALSCCPERDMRPTPQPAVAEVVEQAVAAERERCAKLCDREAYALERQPHSDHFAGGITSARALAAAIRHTALLGTREAK